MVWLLLMTDTGDMIRALLLRGVLSDGDRKSAIIMQSSSSKPALGTFMEVRKTSLGLRRCLLGLDVLNPRELSTPMALVEEESGYVETLFFLVT